MSAAKNQPFILAAILKFNSAYFSDKNVARFLTLIRIF